MAEQQQPRQADPLSPSAKAAMPRAQSRPHVTRDNKGHRKQQAQQPRHKSGKRREDSKLSSSPLQADSSQSLAPAPACAFLPMPASQSLSPSTDSPDTSPAPHRHTAPSTVPRGTAASKANSSDTKDRSSMPTGVQAKAQTPWKAYPSYSMDESPKPGDVEEKAPVPWKAHSSDSKDESREPANIEGRSLMPWMTHSSHSKDENPTPVEVGESAEIPSNAYSSSSKNEGTLSESKAQPAAQGVELSGRSPASSVSPLIVRVFAALTRSPNLLRPPRDQASDFITSQEGDVPALSRRKSQVDEDEHSCRLLPSRGVDTFHNAVGDTTMHYLPRETARDSTGTDKNVLVAIALCAIVCSVLVFGIALAFTLSPNSSSKFLHCSSSDCRRARSFLDSLMDKGVDPCRSFYRHVCRRWTVERYAVGVAHSAADTLTGEAAKDMFSTLHWSVKDEQLVASIGGQTGVAEFAKFYRSCYVHMETRSNVTDAEEDLLGLFHRDMDMLTIPNMSLLLRRVIRLSLTRGVTSLFSTNLVMYHGVVSLHLTPGRTLAEKLGERMPNMTGAKQFIATVLTALHQLVPRLAGENAQSTAAALLELESKFLSHSPTAVRVQTFTAPSFKFLNGDFGNHVWRDVINSIAPSDAQISDKSTVIASGLDTIYARVNHFRKHLKHGVVYVFLHIVMEIGQFRYLKWFPLEQDTTNIVNQLCIGASQDVMPPTWSRLLSNLTHSADSEPSRAATIFDEIQKLAAKRPVISGMTEEDVENAVNSLADVRLALHESSLEPMPNESIALFQSANFSGDFGALYTFLKTAEATRRLRQPPSLDDAILNRLFLSEQVTYSRVMNAVILPGAIRRPPIMYSDRVPIEFDTGTLGVLIAREVFNAGMPTKAEVDGDWYLNNVDYFLRCTETSVQSILHTSLKDMSPTRALDLFSWTRAVKMAHSVMKTSYESVSSSNNFQDVWVTAQQTFFRRYCLLTCNADQSSDEAYTWLRCMVPILNMAEFIGAFDCARVEKMQTLRPCLSI